MAKRRFVWFLFCATAVAIFTLDAVTSVDIPISVLYVTLIMIVLRSGTARDILIAGLTCCILTIASYWKGTGFNITKFNEAGLIDVLISLFAIASVTYLSIKIVHSEASMRKARDQAARTMLNVSINELATSVVHEISQPIGAAAMNNAAARRWLDMTPANFREARAAIDSATLNTQRAESVIQGLRRLSSVSLTDRNVFDVAELMREAIAFLSDEIEQHRIRVSMRLHPNSLLIDGDRTLIQQLLINVINNAIEAMSHDKSENRNLTLLTSASGGLVSIEVQDTGAGISSEHLEQIFDPFYTTKARGLGIGLAISRSIVTSHSGSIQASHNKPTGTIITIRLPTPARSSHG
ncbi:MAG: ATP-binding protein [Methylovirgula sp.]|uniref:sensor histidine kinase n=1 Tax=Methylovirgula sp. TaxID=1978224 RepID=UPI00307650B2